jgi:hypothetical protein
MVEIILMAGVPLKIAANGQAIRESRISEDSSFNSPFRVLTDYRRVGN